MSSEKNHPAPAAEQPDRSEVKRLDSVGEFRQAMWIYAIALLVGIVLTAVAWWIWLGPAIARMRPG